MKDTDSVKVQSVCKKFDIKYTTFYGGVAKSGIKHVLNELTFDVKKGEVLGIVGRNGSGKSTLLKILTGIMYPDSGIVEIRGKVASILELGMGFEPELTGRDNIHIKCGMYGFSEKEINGFIEDIIEFSELGEQIDHPLRTYSSGMTAKLAFSVLIHIKCDVLIIDEVLSVGDASFNAKCKLVFDRMRKEKKTIIIASHNISTLEEMCDRVLWIDSGKTKEIGDAVAVCYHFHTDMTDSFETICTLAESGDVVSQNRLGIMCRDGIGTKKDQDKAIEWFTRSSNMGFTEAQLNLADMKFKTNDKDAAIELYKKASNAGNVIATTRLMLINNNQANLTEKLVSRIREISMDGNMRATKLLADILYNGNIVIKNQAEAYELYIKCANAGDVDSQFMVGICNRDGAGVNKNINDAIKWLSLAAENGNGKSRMELAMIYKKGIGVEKDIIKDINCYKIAAICGDANAMLQLGIIYRDGYGVDKDSTQSEYWFTKFSKQNRLSIEVTFADILRQGYVNSIQNESIFWYEDAAKEGNLMGAVNMALCNRDGIIIPSDSMKAVEWYNIAANMQFSNSIFELASLYLKGNGVSRDIYKAFELMKRSANMGNFNAIFELAKMYKNGIGTEKNIFEANRLFLKLAEFGNYNARFMYSTELE